MKIEKLSDNQIRCTLNKSDLASRHLKLSELAYGSEKAKELFRELMQQASYELGFEAEDIPLMIEAIPVSADCIVLIVTKVEDPEELDTRFSRFSPDNDSDEDYSYDNTYDALPMEEIPYDYDEPLTAADELNDDNYSKAPDDYLEVPPTDVANDVLNLFNKVKDYLNNSGNKNDFVPFRDSFSNGSGKASSDVKAMQESSDVKRPVRTVRIFSFDNFDTFSNAALAISTVFDDINSLYKNPADSRYYLTIENSRCSSANFNKTCNILSEYGKKEAFGSNSTALLSEHFELIIKNRAVQVANSL